MPRVPVLLAVICLTTPLAGCGGDSGSPPPRLTKAEAAELAARRAAERPHFSATSDPAPGVVVSDPGLRAPLVRSLERAVLADARARYARHELDGPFLRTSCKVTRDDKDFARANPQASVLRFDCLAITYESKRGPRMQIGKLFAARVDFEHGRYAWCLRTPVGGEGAHQAKVFDVEPSGACVAPPPGE